MAHENTIPPSPAPVRVSLGDRVYQGVNWTRKDLIFLDKKKVGVITLSREDRVGTTVSTLTGRKERGRKVAWCIEEASARKPAANNDQQAA